MACLFGCFKIKDVMVPSTPGSNSELNRVSQSAPAKEPSASRTRSPLSSLFTEENDETNTLSCKEVENQSSDTPIPLLDTNELRNQAKFLKACGTLPETPAELRNFSTKCKDQSATKEEVEPLKFNSWFSDTTYQKLNSNSLPDQSTPVKIDGVNMHSDSLVHTPSSCLTDGQSDQSLSKNFIDGSENSSTLIVVEDKANLACNDSAVSPITTPTAQYRYRSVHFESESDLSSVSSKCISSETSQSSDQSESSGNCNASKYSPYLTPLKLTDEMQTPGTIFPAYLDRVGIAKAARIRSQYVYPVLNPVNDASQLKELSDEDSYSTQDSNSRLLSSNATDSDQRPEEATRISELGLSGFGESAANKDSKLPSINQLQSTQQLGSVYSEKVHYGRTPRDRPIIGLVATHWHDDETSQISPKWWDGNGIPNSTNKYKEDQKVSWHATPFEERLEKALSEETSNSQRKQHWNATNEAEELNTATSQVR